MVKECEAQEALKRVEAFQVKKNDVVKIQQIETISSAVRSDQERGQRTDARDNGSLI
jgi:hypothetical protein